MNYSMNLLPDPYERIAVGKKTLELRLFDEKRQKLMVGDTIRFSKLPDLSDKLLVEIIGLHRYESFDELLTEIGLDYLGHDKTKNEVLNSLQKIYTPEQEKKYGVLGIQITLIDAFLST